MKKSYGYRWFFGVGATLFLVAVALSALQYPWGMLLGDMSPLPDPEPLDAGSVESAVPSAQTQDAAAPAANASPSHPLAVGIIKIPKIRLSENIVAGTDEALKLGVAHLPDSARPGQPGNCVLNGHRNYIPMRPFRYLDRLEAGNEIEVTVGEETYRYTVFETFVVTPQDTWVMQPQAEHEYLLTLITCTPVIGMQNRLIVRAELIP